MDDKLQKVNFLGQYLTTSRSETQILEMAMLISHDVLGYDHALIRLLNDGELVSRQGIGFPREAADIVIHVGEGISGAVAKTGETILVDDTLNDPRFIKGVENCRSELCVPLKYNDRTIGVFNVESDQPAFFSQRDVQLLETLASQIAAALETARLRDELSRAEKLSVVGKMASSILHDIRNDIHQLNISADLLRRGGMQQETVSRMGDMVRKSSDNIYGLIEDIFDFVRTGHSHLLKKPHLLFPALESVVEQLKGTEHSGVDIQLEADRAIELSMDVRKVRRALVNLVRNGVEAMPAGGTLTIKAVREGEGAVITVDDTGVGISKDNLRKIWEPLFTHGKANGTGLGMAIVKTIIEDHGWQISVESQEGKGTTFTIRAGQHSGKTSPP
ncbi:MAG: GAF domain-containing sensor histidine kinase [Nitrospinae bacterium]|nr:GAF domain-containing sensor histidine kinase [Nitrospinota bacterium]